jgi:hypothetical protein
MDGQTAALMKEPSARERVGLAVASGLLITMPFLAVHFPPITDLPQHTAQVRLFLEAIRNPGGPYTIQWFTPYSAVYLILGAAWGLVGPEHAGRLAMLAIGVMWVAATHRLASQWGRSPAAATLTCIFFFSHVVYWGFYSFALGWPVFVLWLLLTTGHRAASAQPKGLLALAAGTALLYVTHVLWLLVAVLWVLASGLMLRLPLRLLCLRVLAVAPAVLAAIIWYPHLAARGFDSGTYWGRTPLGQLSPAWLADAALGGVRGALEPLVLTALVTWSALGLWQRRRELRTALDRRCLVAGALFLALALVLPGQYQSTIRFAERWMPFAAILTLLGLPQPRLRPALQHGIALTILAVFIASTLTTWIAFQTTELAGLREALDALPPSQRVIGLAFLRRSPVVRARPFIQVFAYAQVLKGGELNFSFADFAPSLVVYREVRRPPWRRWLEWYPEHLQIEDLQYFDYAVVSGPDSSHSRMVDGFGLQPVTAHGLWRLYRVPQ